MSVPRNRSASNGFARGRRRAGGAVGAGGAGSGASRGSGAGRGSRASGAGRGGAGAVATGEPERDVLTGVVGHGLGRDAHRAQLGGDEELDALGVEGAAVLLAHPPGDLLHAAAAVEVRRDDEQQARHVQHLLVGSHDEVVRLGEPRALVLAEQRDARRERGRQERGVGHRRRVLRAGVELALRWRRGSVCVGRRCGCPPRERRPSHLPNGSASAVVCAEAPGQLWLTPMSWLADAYATHLNVPAFTASARLTAVMLAMLIHASVSRHGRS